MPELTARTPLYDEVLAANRDSAAEFGDKGALALPPAHGFAISPAWTPA